MASWLQRQRKADLIELAQQAGINRAGINMRKDDLIVALEQQLHANATALSSKPAFHDYFNRILSPVKKEAEVATSDPADAIAVSVRSKRRTLKEFPSDTDRDNSPVPSASPSMRAQGANVEIVDGPSHSSEGLATVLPSPIPPSPAAVADLVERRTSLAATNIRQYYMAHQIPRHIAALREGLSTVYAVESAFILIEAWGLQRATLPWKYAFSLPPSKFTGDNPIRVNVPDFFVLLDGSFWGPSLVWSLTSFLLPMLFGWLINFTLVHGKGRRGGYEIDPFVFNIVKIITTWWVYAHGRVLGELAASTSVLIVQDSVPGGWRAMVTGATICALVSMYEAILKR